MVSTLTFGSTSGMFSFSWYVMRLPLVLQTEVGTVCISLYMQMV